MRCSLLRLRPEHPTERCISPAAAPSVLRSVPACRSRPASKRRTAPSHRATASAVCPDGYTDSATTTAASQWEWALGGVLGPIPLTPDPMVGTYRRTVVIEPIEKPVPSPIGETALAGLGGALLRRTLQRVALLNDS